MHFSVVNKLRDDYGIVAQPGKKTECPFCGHEKTFSIKEDDTIGKCFHPDCGRFITTWSSGDSGFSDCLNQILERIFGHFHIELMIQVRLDSLNAHKYLVDQRKIHPQVVADSMLGAVPANYPVSRFFEDAKTRLEGKELAQLEEAEDKLGRCIDGARGWLCFFYTDAHHRIVAIRFRKPYEKRFMLFKPFENAGLFGHGLFSPTDHDSDSSFKDISIVIEGEFNQLQLQSLAVRHGEQTGEALLYLRPQVAMRWFESGKYDEITNWLRTQSPLLHPYGGLTESIEELALMEWEAMV